MIQVKDLQKNFGHQTLFEKVNLTIGAKEKVGLIGRNGSGKSTFLNLILQKDEGLDGSIVMPDWYKIKAVEQNLNFEESELLKQVVRALPKDQYGEEWRAKSILMGLGFESSDFNRNPKEFSSGYQVRIRLAEALVSDCHCLFLDEPTNYLDILSLRWLSKFLKNWNGSFVLISHNQHFMSEVVTHTIYIHRKEMRKMKGGPQKIVDQIKMDEVVYEKTRKNQVKKQEKTNEFIRNFRAGARSAGLVQSRIKSLEKQKIGKKLNKIPDIKFKFNYDEFKGAQLLEVSDLTFGYTNDHQIIQNLSFTIHPKDRIAVVGKNGKGKSTLIKLLAGKLKNQSGKINQNSRLKIGHFSTEEKQELSSGNTILQELISKTDNEQIARSVGASLLFTGEHIKKKISQLSGGEKSRVQFGKIILQKNNLLLLDEPTNHLDMESCQALNKALKEYKGAVVFVTHDEGMISEIANRLIIFDNGDSKIKNTTYQEFLEKEGWSEEEKEFKLCKSTSKNKKEYLDQKELKKKRRKNQNDQKKIEEKIEKIERKQHEKSIELQKSYEEKDYEKIKTIGEEVKENQKEIDTLYIELERLIEQELEMER